MKKWQKLFQIFLQRPDLHARFLNTLSLLEYIGARKIMKSQQEEGITPTTLAHMTEEIRHAQILKKMAIKLGGDAVKTYAEDALLCGAEGRAYIQSIDEKASQVTTNPFVNYLLTTLIVEERAQEIYPFYDELLKNIGMQGPMKAIFREEEEHLAQVLELLKGSGLSVEQIESVRVVERAYFEQFFSAVEKVLPSVASSLELQ